MGSINFYKKENIICKNWIYYVNHENWKWMHTKIESIMFGSYYGEQIVYIIDKAL